MKWTVEKMENIHHSGNRHFIITVGKKKYFQSFNTLIAIINDGKITLNRYYWDCSQTTAAYRNKFLCMSSKEIRQKIASGEIKLRSLDSRILCKLNPINN